MIVMKLIDAKSKPDEFIYIYNTSDFEMKSEGEDYYVSGFISTEVVDENGDVVNQDTLLNKLIDTSNPYAKYLSYKHKWLKGDKEDFSNVLGVLQKAEIKENPIVNRPGVWAEYKLLKTSPYFDSAIYDVKNKGVSGFSIEFKEPKRRPISIGSKFASFLEDYVFGGVGIVARAAVKSAIVDGFYLKEYETIQQGDDMMEEKEAAQAPPVQETVVDKPTQTVPEKKEELPKSKDLDILKEEINEQKQELEKLKLQQEKDKIVKELEALKAQSKVLVEQGTHKPEDNAPKVKSNEELINDIKKEAEVLINDRTLSRHEKIVRLLDKTMTQL